MARSAAPGPRSGREAWRLAKSLARGGERREAAVAAVLRPANLFQPYTTTAEDRYPAEFAAAREALPAPAGRVLSFGCASGAELLTAHREFPGALIRGLDINPLAVRTARKRVKEAGLADQITLARAADADAEPAGAYDVVLALAVFRHGDLNSAPPRCDHLLRFDDFERTVAGLARCLADGGLVVIRHANFRVADCAPRALGAVLEPVATGFASTSGEVTTPVYGRDDALIGVGENLRDDGVYRIRRTA